MGVLLYRLGLSHINIMLENCGLGRDITEKTNKLVG